MTRPFRAFRRALSLLLLLAVSATGVVGAFADAAVERSVTPVAAHLEAPGDHPEHAGHDHAACHWCQSLRDVAVVAGLPPAVPAASRNPAPVPGREHLPGRHPASDSRSRAPPRLA